MVGAKGAPHRSPTTRSPSTSRPSSAASGAAPNPAPFGRQHGGRHDHLIPTTSFCVLQGVQHQLGALFFSSTLTTPKPKRLSSPLPGGKNPMHIRAQINHARRHATTNHLQLRRLGYKQIGRGAFARVFVHPDAPDVVIKVGNIKSRQDLASCGTRSRTTPASASRAGASSTRASTTSQREDPACDCYAVRRRSTKATAARHNPDRRGHHRRPPTQRPPLQDRSAPHSGEHSARSSTCSSSTFRAATSCWTPWARPSSPPPSSIAS